jgi:hypothetical protein
LITGGVPSRGVVKPLVDEAITTILIICPGASMLLYRVGETVALLADNGYIGAGEHMHTPYRRRNKPASRQAANRAHAQLRSPGERASAQLKTWHILRKLRCCPWKAGQLANAIHVLQAREIAG